MTIYMSIFMGVALATATGFRIFIPMLLLSIGSITGVINLSGNMAWLETEVALVVLTIASIVELLAYLIPGVDNVLDVIDTPIAVIAGILIVFSVVEVDSMMQWMLAIIIGGVIPALLKAFKATLRGFLSIFTGGMGNVFFAIFEVVASLFIAIIAIFFLS